MKHYWSYRQRLILITYNKLLKLIDELLPKQNPPLKKRGFLFGHCQKTLTNQHETIITTEKQVG